MGEEVAALQMGNSQTAGAVEQQGGGGEEAGAAAQGPQPVRGLRRIDREGGRRAAGINAGTGGRSPDPEIVEVGFDAEHGAADLPVITSGRAAGEAGAVDVLVAG